MRSVLLALLPLVLAPSAALAQKEIPKAPGFDQCPAGYVNTLGTTASPRSITRWLPPTARPARPVG